MIIRYATAHIKKSQITRQFESKEENRIKQKQKCERKVCSSKSRPNDSQAKFIIKMPATQTYQKEETLSNKITIKDVWTFGGYEEKNEQIDG